MCANFGEQEGYESLNGTSSLKPDDKMLWTSVCVCGGGVYVLVESQHRMGIWCNESSGSASSWTTVTMSCCMTLFILIQTFHVHMGCTARAHGRRNIFRA